MAAGSSNLIYSIRKTPDQRGKHHNASRLTFAYGAKTTDLEKLLSGFRNLAKTAARKQAKEITAAFQTLQGRPNDLRDELLQSSLVRRKTVELGRAIYYQAKTRLLRA